MTPSHIVAHRVYDPLLRLLHASLALAVLALIVTSQLADGFEDGPYEDTLWSLHILSGYTLAVSVALRLLWGLIGPRRARWRDFWHPSAWRVSLETWRLPATHRLGHDPLASLAYLFAYGVMVLMVVTGLALAASEFQVGPLAAWLGHMKWVEDLAKAPHEAGFVAMLGFIGLHMAALVFHQLRGERVAQSMLTGKQYRLHRHPDGAPGTRREN